MKIGYQPVQSQIRISHIENTIKVMQIINIRDLSLILGIAESYITRLLRFHVQNVNKKRIVQKSGKKFYVFFVGDLDQEKIRLMKSRYE